MNPTELVNYTLRNPTFDLKPLLPDSCWMGHSHTPCQKTQTTAASPRALGPGKGSGCYCSPSNKSAFISCTLDRDTACLFGKNTKYSFQFQGYLSSFLLKTIFWLCWRPALKEMCCGGREPILTGTSPICMKRKVRSRAAIT